MVEIPRPMNVVEMAELVAQNLANHAEQNGWTPVQLVQVVVLVEQLITRTFPGPPALARAAVFEAHATFNALVQPAMMNDQN